MFKKILRHFRAKRIAAHYNEENALYLSTLGDIIEASRSENIFEVMDHVMREIELKEGDRVLDMGCGVCGPAVYFSKAKRISITGLNVSDVQIEMAKKKIEENKLTKSISIIKSDFHKVDILFPPTSFDKIIFLETFCYVDDVNEMLEKLYRILKPGGVLYIKDPFLIRDLILEDERKFELMSSKMNKQYAMRMNLKQNEIETVKEKFSESKFELKYVRKPTYKTDGYAAYSVFQGNRDLGGDIQDVFRVIDYFEIKAIKLN